MLKQGDTMRCTRKDCKGMMTYYQKLKVEENANPTVQPGDTVGVRSDPECAGWICDTDPNHYDFYNP